MINLDRDIPAEVAALSRIDVRAMPRSFTPTLLGYLAKLTAEAQVYLLETPATPAPAPSRILNAEEAAQQAGVARRWLLITTKGLGFRCDLSKKNARFEEAGFRAWMARRKR